MEFNFNGGRNYRSMLLSKWNWWEAIECDSLNGFPLKTIALDTLHPGEFRNEGSHRAVVWEIYQFMLKSFQLNACIWKQSTTKRKGSKKTLWATSFTNSFYIFKLSLDSLLVCLLGPIANKNKNVRSEWRNHFEKRGTRKSQEKDQTKRD